MKKYFGWGSVFLISLITLVLYFLSKTGFPVHFSWRTVSQVISLIGTSWLCFSFIMTGRFGFINDIFGGIDKMYKSHHIIGGLAFVMVLHHPLFLAIDALPNSKLSANYLFFSDTLAYNLGVISLYAFLLLLALTFLIDLPYSMWKKTHNLMGIPMIFACLHIITITSDVSRYLPLRFWIILLIFAALFVSFYKRFLYEKFGPRYDYLITDIKKNGNIYIFSLQEKNEKMEFRPGQFVFLKINCLGNEFHPFSIVSSSGEKHLRVAIKVLGDYTLGIERACEVKGDCVILGPYGSFHKPMKTHSDIVMIAGGIGITPFVGMIKEDLELDSKRKIDLFYAVRNRDEIVFGDEIEEMHKSNKNLSWNVFVSSEGHRLSAEMINEKIKLINNKKFLLCGPTSMMYQIAEGLRKSGVKNRDIIYEDFSFK